MTNIYIYCLFDRSDAFHGVYSSVDAVHRDASHICRRFGGEVLVENGQEREIATSKNLRNLFRGTCDVQVRYYSNQLLGAKIIKTKLKE